LYAEGINRSFVEHQEINQKNSSIAQDLNQKDSIRINQGLYADGINR